MFAISKKHWARTYAALSLVVTLSFFACCLWSLKTSHGHFPEWQLIVSVVMLANVQLVRFFATRGRNESPVE
jgi:peptidoglycan/LPS O-acetylase OafA/YrhL